MKKMKMTRFLAVLLAAAMALPSVPMTVKAEEDLPEASEYALEEYTLYPKPHTFTYDDGTYILHRTMNVIYDDAIDDATKDRLEETAALKGIKITESDAEKKGTTNVYVAVYGSDDSIDEKIVEENEVDTSVFEKTDSYFLKSNNDVISVLGKDADASFYGVTTLYQIFAQMESLTIRNFTIHDYADVVSRGFIEGYYGNPWSTEDRVNLMTWGGYYKLNAYFYAPKDDAKHRTNWDSLYTEEEIETKIKPLADAGNASKCRFVYALHPFPSGNNFRFDTEEHYQEDLAKLKAKFKQVIDAGVRQIALLADDFVNPGGSNEVKLLQDMTTWLEEEVKAEYPDMKTTLPFVPYDYYGNGSSSELQTLKSVPENVQIVMTGGKIWGEVTDSFTSTFTNNVGRGPFMWINWPCSDNSHKHLIMGGYSTFLHPGVDPDNIQGIMLNPMQQSEPSKVAIFGNAAYSWNIWDTEEEADQAWNDSFSFVDHNSAVETEASKALRELSKHMINQNMDSRVSVLEESVELKEKLNNLKSHLGDESYEGLYESIYDLIDEFELLHDAAETYQTYGNEDIREQIQYWLDCWIDTTDSAIAYLKALKADYDMDVSSLAMFNREGAEAYARSQTHDFLYVDYQEVAEVGVQHIVPFIKALAEYVSGKLELSLNPDKVIQTYVTSREDTPNGSVDNVFDGSDSTSAIYQTPNSITEGTYVGVKYNKYIEINNIRFLLGAGKDHMDHAKLQYCYGGEWYDIELVGMDNEFTGVTGQNQEILVEKENLPEGFEAEGIRLIATADNTYDAWLQVCEIAINREIEEDTAERITGTVAFSGMGIQNSVTADKLFDGDASSEIWLAKDPYEGDDREKLAAGATLTITFDEPKKVGTVTLKQGASASSDVLSNATLQYQVSGSEQWVDGGSITSATEQTIDLGTVENVTAVRIYNNTQTNGWVRIGEIDIRTAVEGTKGNTQWVYSEYEFEGVESVQTEGETYLKPAAVQLGQYEYVGIDLGSIRAFTDISIIFNTTEAVKLQYSTNTLDWKDITEDTKQGDVRYVRIYNAESELASVEWTKFSVSYEHIGEKTVTSDFSNASSTRDMRTAGTVANVFDGDLTTYGSIAGAQMTGKQIVFDLGQSIDFTSIRYYVKETSKDYLRYAKFEVSDDPEAEDSAWTTVLTVGDDSFANEYDESTAKEYASLTHDSQNPGNMYAEQTGLNVSGRYLRVVPLKDYSYRWVDFYEIQINGGAYVSTETARDITSTVVEEEGKVPSNAFNESLTSVYKPSETNGSFTYRISEPRVIRTIRMIQNGTPSNAVVTAKIAKEDGTQEETITLGVLNQTLNEYAVPFEKRILEITVSWTDKIPEIAMIKVSENDLSVNDDVRNVLKNQMDAAEEIEEWTEETKSLVRQAMEVAQNIYDNPYATHDTIDSARAALWGETDRAEQKIGESVLEYMNEAIENKEDMIENGIYLYTAASYDAYAIAMDRIEKVLTNLENLSHDESLKLNDALVEAQENLLYSKMEFELAQLDLEAGEEIQEYDYTSESYREFKEQYDLLAYFVATCDEERPYPREVYRVRSEYLAVLERLVPVVNPFIDVKSDAYYYSPVLWAVENGITTGTTETTFSPKTDCTRAQVVMFLWRVAGCPEEEINENPFSDISEGSRFYSAIVWAFNHGITTGYTDGTFRPNDPVRRAEYITLQYRAAGEPEVTLTENPFSDVTKDKFPHFYNAILWASENGITEGKDGKFLPNDNCSRANVVTFLYREANL